MNSSTFSLFAQVLALVDRKDFDALARKHGVERASKGFGSWNQFVAMAFAQLSDAGSLRETILGLASASGKLRHLGIDSAPWRSTLSDLAASTVGRIYRERWKIKMFFKALKQNLRVKTFFGTKENAVQTQIWTALIAILLMKYLQMRSQWSWSMSNLIAALRVCMFAHKDFGDWLDGPTAKNLVSRDAATGCSQASVLDSRIGAAVKSGVLETGGTF